MFSRTLTLLTVHTLDPAHSTVFVLPTGLAGLHVAVSANARGVGANSPTTNALATHAKKGDDMVGRFAPKIVDDKMDAPPRCAFMRGDASGSTGLGLLRSYSTSYPTHPRTL